MVNTLWVIDEWIIWVWRCCRQSLRPQSFCLMSLVVCCPCAWAAWHWQGRDCDSPGAVGVLMEKICGGCSEVKSLLQGAEVKLGDLLIPACSSHRVGFPGIIIFTAGQVRLI